MVSAKFELKYESSKSKFSLILFAYNLMIGYSKKNKEKLSEKVLLIPWVPEVFLACGGNFRCWPKADTSSAVGRSHEQAKPREKPLARSGAFYRPH